MINKAEIGNRICSLRKECGYSQNTSADRLGVSAQAVPKWETGLSLPDKDIAKKITAHGGLILEIGASVGGGYIPAVLIEDFDANSNYQ